MFSDNFMLLGVFTFYLYVRILFERKYLVFTLGIIWQFNFTLQFYTFDSVCIWVLNSFLLIVFLFGWSVREKVCVMVRWDEYQKNCKRLRCNRVYRAYFAAVEKDEEIPSW